MENHRRRKIQILSQWWIPARRGTYVESRNIQRNNFPELVLQCRAFRLREEPQDIQVDDADFRLGGDRSLRRASYGCFQVATLGEHEE